MQAQRRAGSETDEEIDTLFRRVRFWINPQVGKILETKLDKVISSCGGVSVTRSKKPSAKPQKKELSFYLDQVTHVITFNCSIPGFNPSTFPNIALVTPDWVLRSFKFQKLYSPEFYSPDPSRIFSGMVLATSQLPIDDSEIIFGAVSALGGQFRRAFVSDVTHLITTQSGGPKYEKAVSDDCETVVVSPHWFDDCLRLRKRLPELHYSFPNPSIFAPKAQSLVNINKRCSPLLFKPLESDSVSGNLSPETKDPFLSGRVFYLDKELNVSSDTFSSIKSQLVSFGAKVVDKFTPEVTCYVCPNRANEFYNDALRKRVEIGNLTWVIHILINCNFDSPFSQLLFYPVIPYPAKNMESLSISFTNYCTGAREYLQRMASAMGATCTPHLSPYNTHLVCASPNGAKYEKALEWNVVVVNHLWIEDSYRMWCCQAVTKPQYTHFPVGVNLDHLVSQAPYHVSDIKLILGPESNQNLTAVSESDIVQDSDASQPFITQSSSKTTQAKTKGNGKKLEPNESQASYKKPSRSAANSASQALAKLMETQNEYEKNLKSKSKSLSTSPLPIKDLEENAKILPHDSNVSQSKKQELSTQPQKQVASSQPKKQSTSSRSKKLESASQLSHKEPVSQSKKQAPSSQSKKQDVSSQSKKQDVSSQSKKQEVSSQSKNQESTPQPKMPETSSRSRRQVVSSQLKEQEPSSQPKKPTSSSRTRKSEASQLKDQAVSSQLEDPVTSNQLENQVLLSQPENQASSRRNKRTRTSTPVLDTKPNARRSTRSTATEIEEPKSKKAKIDLKEKSSSPAFRILFTGYKPSTEEKKAIKTLGGKLVETTDECTHLIAQSAMRTAKLVCAISRCCIIVSKDWLTESIESKFFIDEADYILKDTENEKQYKFSLKESLQRAQKGKLLQDFEVALSPNVLPSPSILKTIIDAAGGKVITAFPAKRLISEDGTHLAGSNLKLLILGDPKDKDFLISRLGSKVTSSKSPIHVYKTELIMAGALCQKLDTSSENYLFK